MRGVKGGGGDERGKGGGGDKRGREIQGVRKRNITTGPSHFPISPVTAMHRMSLTSSIKTSHSKSSEDSKPNGLSSCVRWTCSS